MERKDLTVYKNGRAWAWFDAAIYEVLSLIREEKLRLLDTPHMTWNENGIDAEYMRGLSAAYDEVARLSPAAREEMDLSSKKRKIPLREQRNRK